MAYVYLDLNVFDRLEKLNSLIGHDAKLYGEIHTKIVSGEIITPFSNAHIHDLRNGYLKNPNFITGHLASLGELTKSLCVVQYWGNDFSTWHYRNINDFFYESLEEYNNTPQTFKELMDGLFCALDDNTLDLDSQSIAGLIKMRDDFLSLSNLTLDEEFLQVFEFDPVFKQMWPITYKEKTLFALMEDIYQQGANCKNDFNVYKLYKSYLSGVRKKFKDFNLPLLETDNGPKHLTFDEAMELNIPKTRTSMNTKFDEITNRYFRLDQKGFKSDDKFINMINDSLHTFYAAHCDFFVTNDDKCHFKAKEVYRQLGIPTKVMKPNEFVQFMK